MPQYSKRANSRHPDEPELVLVPTVVSFDPGGVTGWSVMSVHPEALTDPTVSVLDNLEHWSHGQIACATDGKYDPIAESRAVVEMAEICANWEGALIVVEDFIMRSSRRDRETLTPVRLIAGLDLLLFQNKRRAIRQQPSEAKTTATDERMKLWGLYERSGGMQHARDADRHSIVALRKAKQDRRRRGRFWPHLYSPDGALL